MHTVDDLNIVEITASLDESEFSLCSWLLEPLTWFAPSVTATAVGCFTESTSVAVGSASDDTTPDDFLVSVDGNGHVSLVILVQFVVVVLWLWVLPETLSDVSSLDTMGSLEAIIV